MNPPMPLPALTEQQKLLELVERYGRNLHSFMVFEPGLSIWFGEDSAIAYTSKGGYWVAVGGPLCAAEKSVDVLQEFRSAAQKHGCGVVFFGVTQPLVDRIADTDFDAMQIGLAPIWDPADWDNVVRGASKLRNRLNKAKRDGIVCRKLSLDELQSGSETRETLCRIADQWAMSKALPPMGFMVTLELFQHSERRRYFVAEYRGEIQGLAVCIPVYGRNGWLVEDMLIPADAPGGVSEALIDHAMRYLANEKCEFVSLGLVALAGLEGSPSEAKHPYLSQFLRTCSKTMGWLYNFDGLYRFRNKLKPTRWEPIYIVAGSRIRFLTIRAILMAFAKGWVPRFGIRVLGHWYHQRRMRQAYLDQPNSKPMFAWPTLSIAFFSLTLMLCSVLGILNAQLSPLVGMMLGTLAAYIGFTPIHEAVHGNVSRYRWLNSSIGHLCALLLNGAFLPYCYLHRQHHQHTNDEPHDPDYWCARGPTWLLPLRWATQDVGYLKFYFEHWSTRPSLERFDLIASTLLYVSVAIATILWYPPLFWAMLWAWFIPARIALFLLAATFSYLPHAPHQEQAPCRATSVRSATWLFWLLLGQNFHLVHHLSPGIPFYRLRRAWEEQKADLLAQGGIDHSRD